MPENKNVLRVLDFVLIGAHVIVDGYFFFVIIPTNFIGSYELKLFNVLFAGSVGVITLIYNLKRSFAKWRCPITDIRNTVSTKLDSRKKVSETAIGSFIAKFRGKEPSLQTVNRVVYLYIVLIIVSFLPAF